MCLFLFLQMFFEFCQSSLQVTIDFNVSCHNSLHTPHILVNIVFNRAYSLHIRYQLTFFSKQLSGFFKVLKVAVKEFFLFFYNSVDFFVESKELLWINHVFTRATSHSRLPEASLSSLPFICTCSQCVFEVVPILLLFLLQFLLVTKLLIVGGDLILRWSKLRLAGWRRNHILPLWSFLLFFRGFIHTGTL